MADDHWVNLTKAQAKAIGELVGDLADVVSVKIQGHRNYSVPHFATVEIHKTKSFGRADSAYIIDAAGGQFKLPTEEKDN